MRGMFIAIASSFAAFGSLVQAAEPGPKREALEIKSELVAGRGEVHAVEASIDGRRVLVAIDSGSSGLRILRRPLTRATAAAAAQSEFTFAIGTRLVGDIGRVHLNLGALSGDLSALNVHAIGCTRQVADSDDAATLFRFDAATPFRDDAATLGGGLVGWF